MPSDRTRPASLEANDVHARLGRTTALAGISVRIDAGGCVALVGENGAGDLGEPIVTGLLLSNTNMILSCALPAAALALVVDGALLLIERRVMPAHLRRRNRLWLYAPRPAGTLNGPPSMSKALWIIVAVLVAFWLAGAVIGFVGDIIHFVLVVAVALAIFAFVKRKV